MRPGPAISATVAPEAASAAKPPPLVNADDELAGFLEQAQDFVEKGSYGRAIEILQAMILRPDAGFVASADGRHFVALWRKANDVIGSMGSDGLKLYRVLYDSQARRLYEKACESGDTTALRRVAHRHMHTTVAPKALATLAAIHFDRAEFAQAARCWKQALKVQRDPQAEALSLVRIATASHLAGQKTDLQTAEATLSKRFASSTAILGGRKQNLLEFVARVRKMPVPSAAAPRSEGDWPGLGGIPDGIATMSECDVVLSPTWQAPKPVHSGRIRTGDLIALRNLLGMPIMSSGMHFAVSSRISMPARGALALKLRNGHVFAQYRHGNQTREIVVPPVVHPVVVGQTVVYRTDDAVVACNLLTGGDSRTGKPLWQAKLPLHRAATVSARIGYGYGPWIGDSGRYMLTAGGGKVFALYDYLPTARNPRVFGRIVRPGVKKGWADTSSLVALSVRDQGTRVWQLPNKDVTDDVITNGKFVSPPTYAEGRLYIITKHLESYYLLCIGGDTGRLVWKASISQVPAVPRQYQNYGMGVLLDRCSPPAVADGRVFALTNAGAVAAFEADSGQAIWAYQYESDVNARRSYPYSISTLRQKVAYMPPNPVIVARGRVIFLPADGNKALALAVEDGKCVWAAPAGRMDQRHLSAIGGDRILLSSPQLIVLSSATGKVLHDSSEAKGVYGRPAVTKNAVHASGLGKMYRLSLDDYDLTSSDLADASGLLGNLASINGKLIAANVVGLSTYFNYDQVRKEIASRLADAQPRARADMLFQQVRLSFNAKRFARTLEDIDACGKVAGEIGDSLLVRQLQTWAHRAYVALGNKADLPEKMLQMYKKGLALAETKQAKGHMNLRVAKCLEKMGDLWGAAALAQEISEKYADEELVNVEIGPEADMSVRFAPETQRHLGRSLGQRFIKRLIEIHGRDVYASFDEKAKLSLEEARAKVDPDAMAAVADRWPHSLWADDALLSAAEVRYREAIAADGDKGESLMLKAQQHLSVVAHMSDSPLRPSANIALAIIYARGQKTTMARVFCNQVRALPGDTIIAFADIKGKLGQIIKRLDAGKVGPPIKVELPQTAAINPPLKKIFDIPDVKAFILRDQEFRAPRLGSHVFVVHGNRVVMLDTAAGSAEKATRWSGLTSIDADALIKGSYYNPGYRLLGALSTDHKVLLVAHRLGMSGIDVGNGKVVWQKKMGDLGISSFHCMSVGRGVLVVVDAAGKLTCVEVATGQIRWRAMVVGGGRSVAGPPKIGRGLVLTKHDGNRRLTCFDLVTGKVVGVWRGSYVDGYVTGEGLVVTMIDGLLSVLDRGQMGKALWTRKYASGPYSAILAVGANAVVVSPANNNDVVEVLSITGGGRLLASLTGAQVASFKPIPVEAAFDGQNVYVTYSLMAAGRRKYLFGRTSTSRGMIVQKFDLAGRRLWTRNINTAARSYYYCLPVVIGKKHLVVTARQTNYTMPSHVHVLTGVHGRQVEQIDLRGAGANPTTLTYRMSAIGPPVMTGGRLCVETGQGVSIYGER